MNIQNASVVADNGVNVDALLGARAALADAPQAAQFTWHAECTWMGGVHSRSTITSFSGLGAEHQHEKPFTVDCDHPAIFAASDKGATPIEIVLSALASCLSAGVASVAQNRGIQLRSVTARVEGDMDLYGILGIDPEVRNGFSAIRVRFDIDAHATQADLEAVVAQSQRRSAVFDIITNPGAVTVSVG